VLCRLRGRASRGVLGCLIAAGAAIMLSASPVAAQNIFEQLFGGIRRALPPAPYLGAHPPMRVAPLSLSPHQQSERVAPNPGGPRTGFCVRLCDGRYFPVQARRNASTVAQCSSFCPASKTKVFSGTVIDHAVSGDGRRYADLPNAFVYRQRMVPGCTCDGRSATGVASVPIEEDATLRSGDIVATDSGLTVYNGRDPHREAAFTPIESAKVSKSLRNQLADVKVTPRPPSAVAAPVSTPQNQASIAGELRLLSARAQ
jgi:hypothetical protein